MSGSEGSTRRSPIGTLVLAWVVVVGMTFAPIGTYAVTTHNLPIAIAFLAAMLLIGLALFLAMGLARMGTRGGVMRQEGQIANLNHRGGVFGARGPRR